MSNPPDARNWKQISLTVVQIVFAPLHMYIGHLKIAFLDLKLKIQPTEAIIIAKEELKQSLNIHVKLELGLETIYQLSGQLILLFLAYTETPTQNGLKTIFNDGLDPWNLTLLITSIILSFNGCISSHCKALMACREHFPFKTRLIASFYSLIGCIVRVCAIVMFFAGPLGLFSLLRHLQAEQYPWQANVLEFVSSNHTISIGDNEAINWTLIDRWQKNGPLFQEHENGELIINFGKVMPNPSYLVSGPDYTFYVGFKLKFYLIAFFAHLGVHMLAIFVAKIKLSLSFKHSFNILEKFIHCLENSNLPYNAKEWDDGEGDAQAHKDRMQSNWFEVLAIILINGLFNILLLLPLFFLGELKSHHTTDI